MSSYSNSPQITTTVDVPEKYSGLEVKILNRTLPYDTERPIESIDLVTPDKKECEFMIKIADTFLSKGVTFHCEKLPGKTLSDMIMDIKGEEYDWIKKATDPVFYQRVPGSSPDFYWCILSPSTCVDRTINYGGKGENKYLVRRESSKSLINRTTLEFLL